MSVALATVSILGGIVALGTILVVLAKITRKIDNANGMLFGAVDQPSLHQWQTDAASAQQVTAAKVQEVAVAVGEIRDHQRAITDSVATIRHEVTTNNGGSLKDSMSRTERNLAEHLTRYDERGRSFDEWKIRVDDYIERHKD